MDVFIIGYSGIGYNYSVKSKLGIYIPPAPWITFIASKLRAQTPLIKAFLRLSYIPIFILLDSSRL